MAPDIDPGEYVTFSQAARLRREAGLKSNTRQAIWNLVERGKLHAFEIAGNRFVKKQEVLDYRGTPGRPPTRAVKKNSPK